MRRNITIALIIISFVACSQKEVQTPSPKSHGTTKFELPKKVPAYHDRKESTPYEDRKLQETIEKDTFKHRKGKPEIPQQRGNFNGTDFDIFYNL